jgi:hypothetical protein
MRRSFVRAGLFAAFATLGCTLARPAAADPVSLRLDYDLPASLVEACPNASSFRNLVAARLGYDPFEPHPAMGGAVQDAVRVTLFSHDHHVQADALLVRQGRPTRPARALEGSLSECEALVSALATTIAIALDDGEHAPAPPAAPPQPALAAPPPPAPPPERHEALPAVAPRHREPLSIFVAVAPVVSVGAMPSLSLGGEAGAGLRRGHFSIEGLIRAETTAAATRVASGDRLKASVFTGAALPCGEVANARICGVGRIGRFEGSDPDLPGGSTRLNAGSLYASLGLRLGYWFRLSSSVTLEPSIEGDIPLVITKLVVSSATVWTAPIVYGTAAVTAAVAF